MPLEYDRQINIRVNMETQLYLISLGDYSPYIRDLIEKDRISKRDPKIIDAKLKELEKQIRDLKQTQTKAKELPTADQILEKWHNIFRTDQIGETDVTNIHRWIRAHVIPELEKAGIRNYDSHKVLELFAGMDKKKGGEP